MRIRLLFIALAIGALAGMGSATAVAEPAVPPDYLVGEWSLEGADRCGITGIEHVMFYNDGTVRVDRGHRVDGVGFWEVSNNKLVLHMVASPYGSESVPQSMKGEYGYADLAVFVFDMTPKSFEAVVPFEGNVLRRVAHRCR